LKLNFDRY